MAPGADSFFFLRPPLSSRIIRFIDRIYMFFGLYLVTLFAVRITYSLASYLIQYDLTQYIFLAR